MHGLDTLIRLNEDRAIEHLRTTTDDPHRKTVCEAALHGDRSARALAVNFLNQDEAAVDVPGLS